MLRIPNLAKSNPVKKSLQVNCTPTKIPSSSPAAPPLAPTVMEENVEDMIPVTQDEGGEDGEDDEILLSASLLAEEGDSATPFPRKCRRILGLSSPLASMTPEGRPEPPPASQPSEVFTPSATNVKERSQPQPICHSTPLQIVKEVKRDVPRRRIPGPAGLLHDKKRPQHPEIAFATKVMSTRIWRSMAAEVNLRGRVPIRWANKRTSNAKFKKAPLLAGVIVKVTKKGQQAVVVLADGSDSITGDVNKDVLEKFDELVPGAVLAVDNVLVMTSLVESHVLVGIDNVVALFCPSTTGYRAHFRDVEPEDGIVTGPQQQRPRRGQVQFVDLAEDETEPAGQGTPTVALTTPVVSQDGASSDEDNNVPSSIDRLRECENILGNEVGK